MRENEMRTAKLSELFDMQMGKTPDRNNPEYWKNGTHPWISIADMTSNGKHIKYTKECITQKAVDVTGIKPIYPGTPIMSFKLSVGKVAVATTKCYSNEAIMAFNIPDVNVGNPMLTEAYSYYLLKSLNFDNVGNKAVMGKTLNKAILSDTVVKYHIHPDKQCEIVKVLDKVCELIDYRKQQLQQLDDLVKARFVEMFGDRYTNDKKWDNKPLYECADFYNGKAHEQVVDENGEYILVTSRCIASDISDYRRTNALLFPLQVNDIAMVMSDVPNGKALAKCILIDEDRKYTLNQRICCLRNYSLNPIFFYHLLNRHEYFLSFNDGNAQTNLRKDDLLACNIIIPPLELQNEFANFVEQVDKSKAAVQKALDEAQTLFDSLMQEYFG